MDPAFIQSAADVWGLPLVLFRMLAIGAWENFMPPDSRRTRTVTLALIFSHWIVKTDNDDETNAMIGIKSNALKSSCPSSNSIDQLTVKGAWLTDNERMSYEFILWDSIRITCDSWRDYHQVQGVNVTKAGKGNDHRINERAIIAWLFLHVGTNE